MRLILALAAATASLLCLSAPAQAGLLPGTCSSPSVSKPFLPWLDVMDYVLAPDGGVEAGAAGWTLSGATVVDGNEPWLVGGANDSKSLAIPEGGSATTSAMCAGLNRPTVRFFARSTSGERPLLKVEVLSAAADFVTALPADRSWQPTPALPILAGLLPSPSGDRAVVAFRFTALGGGFEIDDVYVDPYGRY